MAYKSNKKLKRLSDKQFAEDIKKYIKSSHEFYGTRIPELKVLAKRLYEEYDLKSFYRVFNRFWNSSYHEERSLAIYTLELYYEEFDLDTWKFMKTKLKEIKSWDKLDSVGINIVGEILIREDALTKEITTLAKSKNIWLKRMALMSTIPSIRNDNIELGIKLCEFNINSKEENIQKAVGMILNEIAKVKPRIARRFILKNIKMPEAVFFYATENLKDLRKLRETRKMKPLSLNKLFFWRD